MADGVDPDLNQVLTRIDEALEQSLERLFALLQIPSVSTESAHRADCAKAAGWLHDELSGLGFETEIISMEAAVPGGHPLVVASHPGVGPDLGQVPTALFYGHYDVQPIDPITLWDHQPFSPRIETLDDGSKIIRARGASDDKGQMMTFIEALRAWRDVAGGPPIPVKLLIEGEEEAGGRSMGPFLAAHAQKVKADLAMVCDTNMWARGRPAITMSLRGIVTGTVRIKAANRDLHSGHYGSAARNALALMVHILAALRDEDGAVTLDGFYDAVPETPAAMLESWDTLAFDSSAFLGDIGLALAAGEHNRSILEQCWARPTAEINGIWGGYTGDGFKTVIPSEGHAKVSFRLVGDQDPEKIWASFKKHVRDRLPADCRVAFDGHGGAKAISIAPNNPYVAKANAALQAEWGVPVALTGCGGSIPVVENFKRILNMDTLLVGFGLDDDNIHAPNEKYDLVSFRRGARSWARILAELGRHAAS
jgi:acetylornithine deacetylase/succinyl-diaminopimelate desuccinylase-like protein